MSKKSSNRVYGNLSHIKHQVVTSENGAKLVTEAINGNEEEMVLIIDNGEVEIGFGTYRKQGKKDYIAHSDNDLIEVNSISDATDLMHSIISDIGGRKAFLSTILDGALLDEIAEFNHCRDKLKILQIPKTI